MITLPAERPADDAAPPIVPDYYAGLATRVLAFAMDAAIINAIAWFVAVVVGRLEPEPLPGVRAAPDGGPTCARRRT